MTTTLNLENVPANGDCFFESIVRQFKDIWPLKTPLTTHLQRKWIANIFVPENQEQVTEIINTWRILYRDQPTSPEFQFMKELEGFDTATTSRYLHHIVQDRTRFWSNDFTIQVVLQVLVLVFQRPVKLMLVRALDNITPMQDFSSATGSTLITYLYYSNGNHYQPILVNQSRIFVDHAP